VSRTGFAKSDRGLEYALVQDATGESVGAIHEMSPTDRRVTALVRARFWKWWAESLFDDGGAGKRP
jgi:hypothetical protein